MTSSISFNFERDRTAGNHPRSGRSTETGGGKMQVERVSSGAPWERQVGYSRAVRAGAYVAISGTAPVGPDGAMFGGNDGEAQARRCLEIIDSALEELGLDRTCIVRTRMFVTDIARWEEFGRAHSEFFGEARPATSMVEVRALIDPDMLIEIEADAIEPPDTGAPHSPID